MSGAAVLRPAEPWDLPRLAELEPQLFPQDAWPQEMLAAEIGHPTRSYWIAQRPGTGRDAAGVLGYAGVMVVGDTADVHTVGVVDAARGQGIGGELMRRLHAEAVRAGAERILLEVRAGNAAALRLYERLGYARIDRRARYYPGGEDAVIMLRELTAADDDGAPPAPDGPAARQPADPAPAPSTTALTAHMRTDEEGPQP